MFNGLQELIGLNIMSLELSPKPVPMLFELNGSSNIDVVGEEKLSLNRELELLILEKLSSSNMVFSFCIAG